MMTAEVAVPAPAKLNLRLRVLAREAEGYHQLETIFCALDLADAVAVAPAHRIELEVEGSAPCPPEQNLAVRAARAFLDACGGDGARIRLAKRIPAGAGLGGGSSDAAATLRALDRLYETALPESELLRLGAGLGSDVPFFLCGSPLALAWGRGERLLPLPALPPKPVLIAVPPFAIDTGRAYRWLDEDGAGGETPAPDLLSLESLHGWEPLAALADNDFEPPVFRRHPALGSIREALDDAGASIARLCGSGSCVFGLFDSGRTRDRARDALAARFPDSSWIATATRGPR